VLTNPCAVIGHHYLIARVITTLRFGRVRIGCLVFVFGTVDNEVKPLLIIGITRTRLSVGRRRLLLKWHQHAGET